MSFTFSAARDVSSFLVPHQSADDLVSRGIPAREARRRSYARTCLMERLSTMIHGLLVCGMVVPFIILGLLVLSLLIGLVFDMVHQSHAACLSIIFFVFGHFEDSCKQPLGPCLKIFWIFTASKLCLLFLWMSFADSLTNYLGDATFRNLSACLCGSFAVVTVLFEVIWPATTLIMLLLANSCTTGLIASTWVVMPPFFLEALCCWPIASLAHPWEDPAELVDSFARIRFDPDTSNDETYATNCAICLSDFAASHEIVLAPCTGRHVFHEGCLAGWLRTAQTCPLCREPLSSTATAGTAATASGATRGAGAGTEGLELPLAQPS